MTLTEIRLTSIVLRERMERREADGLTAAMKGHLSSMTSPDVAQQMLAALWKEVGVTQFTASDILTVMSTLFDSYEVEAYTQHEAPGFAPWNAFHEDIQWALRTLEAKTPPPTILEL